MLDTTGTTKPTAQQRARAIRAVHRNALDKQDEAELIAMLGLDQEPRPAPAPRPHRTLSAEELFDLFASFGEQRVGAKSR
ncbi:hypothetical protein ACWEHA_07275 [Amycolatopsis nivea]